MYATLYATVTAGYRSAKDNVVAAERDLSFGDQLRRYRTAAGLTQQALAERAGLSRRGIADLERGARRVPQANTVARLVEALGMTTGESPVSQRRHAGRSLSDRALRQLPAFPTSFIGREAQVHDVMRQLAQTRLLTLVGPGGVGKTRLAVAAAEAAARIDPDGVAFADLSALRDASLVVQTVAAALGLEEQSGRTLREAVVEWLRTRRLLLVLDNCEHLIQDCAELIEQLLQVRAELRILATSREPTGVAGEIVWRVPSLDLPDLQHMPTLERMPHVEAVRLFVERARAVQTNFELTELNTRAVAEICVRLDGIPLAIELAAAHSQLLSAQELAVRLAQPLQVLTRGGRIYDAWNEYVLDATAVTAISTQLPRAVAKPNVRGAIYSIGGNYLDLTAAWLA